MAKNGIAEAGSKRKLANGSKDKSGSKKTKFEKPSPSEESESVSDDDNNSDKGVFSDDNEEDGGAQLHPDRAAQVPGADKGNNSRESHIKQKAMAKERRDNKPLADELTRTKKLWERLRRKSHVPKEERQKLVDELFTITTGRMKEFALKHDAVRVVQTAIKYSTAERRRMIATELKGTYATLAESKYAKFLIGKLMVEGDKEVRDLIVPEFYGKVRKLINHPEASWILDDIYRGAATKEQKSILLREWYGPEFSIFRAGPGEEAPSAELAKIIEEEPMKRVIIMRYLREMTNMLIQKKLTGFTMLHDAMLQYFLNAKPGTEELKEYIEMIKEDENDLLKNMAFTQSGAKLVCLLLAHGSAKDRKQILKSYKDTFQLMASDPHGHMIILAAYDVIDDTVLTSKSIIPEVLGKSEDNQVSNVVICANDPNARLTVRYLLEGASKALFDASHASDLELLKELWEIRKTTSKKDAEIRRKELATALSPPLFSAIASAPADLLSTSFGCQLVAEALLSGVGDKQEALEAVAAAAGGSPDEGDSPMEGAEETVPEFAPQMHISKAAHIGRMFKSLIAGGKFDKATKQIIPVDPPLHFADILYPVIKDHIISWATGPSSFVVVSLLEVDDFSSKDELKKLLKKEKKTLEKAATEETLEQKGFREAAEAAEAEPVAEDSKPAKPTKKGKKVVVKKDRPIGNAGSKLLLEKLKA